MCGDAREITDSLQHLRKRTLRSYPSQLNGRSVFNSDSHFCRDLKRNRYFSPSFFSLFTSTRMFKGRHSVINKDLSLESKSVSSLTSMCCSTYMMTPSGLTGDVTVHHNCPWNLLKYCEAYFDEHCFHSCYMRKKLVAWEGYCAKDWKKKLQESSD